MAQLSVVSSSCIPANLSAFWPFPWLGREGWYWFFLSTFVKPVTLAVSFPTCRSKDQQQCLYSTVSICSSNNTPIFVLELYLVAGGRFVWGCFLHQHVYSCCVTKFSCFGVKLYLDIISGCVSILHEMRGW